MLYLIPVPIADDALHTLPEQVQEVARGLDFFIVERAKTARHFLKSIGIKRPLPEVEVVEIDERQANIATNALRAAHQQGRSVGLLSEAGCPGVADPGADVVATAHAIGMRVVPLVGPSSLLLALMASGMNGQQFAFHGYLPAKRPELARELRRLEQVADRTGQTQLFIETPYRSQMVIEVALESLLPDTRLAVAQDLTGQAELIRSAPVRDWKKGPPPTLQKLPAVFLLHRRGSSTPSKSNI
jgi:16S rRNA (cytidine1402-2'-O)-methyltransferase